MSVYLVDRTMNGKCQAYVPWVSGHVTPDELRAVLGPRAHLPKVAGPEGEPTMLVYSFSRRYVQAVVTYLRTRSDCEAVRFRSAHSLNEHCTPQCEGAWKQAEEGQYHEDECQCRCGGTRHNAGNPWWSRWDAEDVSTDGKTIVEVRVLPPLRVVTT